MVKKKQKLVFPKAAQQQYAGKVDMTIIVVLQITSVYCVLNIMEIG